MSTSFSSASSIWHCLGASVTGTSHLKLGRACDDDHAYRQLENGSLMAAVADGAGSAARSGEGAHLAVQKAIHVAEALLMEQGEPTNDEQWNKLLSDVVKVTRISLESLAANQIAQMRIAADEEDEKPSVSTSSLREFATTLLFAIVTTQWVAVAQIGDGAVVILRSDGTQEVFTQPDHGQYINETSFITQDDYLGSLQLRVEKTVIQGIALFTDGLEMLAIDMSTGTPHPPFFVPLFKFATDADSTEAELSSFLQSERVCTRTDDDKTLVLAVRI